MTSRSSVATRLLAIAMAVWCAGALAGGPADTRVSGTIDNVDPTDGFRHEQFTCFGMPTCSGTHTVTVKPKQCSNGTVFTNNAILNYTVDGVSGTKSVTRQLF